MEKIQESPDCCDVWPKIASRFDWMTYQDQPIMATMPHIDTGKPGEKFFVNYCPSCGKPVRNINMLMDIELIPSMSKKKTARMTVAGEDTWEVVWGLQDGSTITLFCRSWKDATESACGIPPFGYVYREPAAQVPAGTALPPAAGFWPEDAWWLYPPGTEFKVQINQGEREG